MGYLIKLKLVSLRSIAYINTFKHQVEQIYNLKLMKVSIKIMGKDVLLHNNDTEKELKVLQCMASGIDIYSQLLISNSN